MKKFTSLLICACVLITNLFVFTSCIHFKCDFSEEWSNDADSHWHECTNGKCEKISDKEAHLFNEGEIKVKATQEADGIRIQNCSTCNAKKEVPVLFTGLDWTEWELALSEEKFANFTYHEKAVVEYSGVQVISVAEYKFTENEIYASLTVAGSTSTDSASGLQAASTKKSMIESIQKMLKYGEFEYDRENKIYNLTGEMWVESTGKAQTATLKFENGLLKELTYTGVMIKNGLTMNYTSTITFSNYGTTKI